MPAMGERVLTLMVGIVDTMLVGHLGASALAAVSLANEWTFVFNVLMWSLGTGATALVARSVGAGDGETSVRATHQSVLIGVGIALLASILFIGLAEPAMVLIGAAPDVRLDGAVYMRIVALSFPLAAVMFVGNACLRGAGDTRTTMMVMAVVNVLNIGVAWAAINGQFGFPKMGVAGSALGALVGQASGGLLVAFLLVRGRSGLKLLPTLRTDREMVKRVLRVGVPAGVEHMSWRLGMMAFARAVAGLGTVTVAAHAVVLRAESLSYMPGFGFATAGTALVGQNLGARDPDQAEQTGYQTLNMAALIMSVIGLGFIFAPDLFIRFFTDDRVVIETAVMPLRIIGLVQIPLAASFVFTGCLRGAGDTRYPMMMTTLAIWLVRVPTALVLGIVLEMGLSGVWLGIAADLIVRALVYFLRFRGGKWKLVEV